MDQEDKYKRTRTETSHICEIMNSERKLSLLVSLQLARALLEASSRWKGSSHLSAMESEPEIGHHQAKESVACVERSSGYGAAPHLSISQQKFDTAGSQ